MVKPLVISSKLLFWPVTTCHLFTHSWYQNTTQKVGLQHVILWTLFTHKNLENLSQK